MKEQINRCEEKFLQGLRTSDIATLEELLHDDLIYNAATGDVMTKEMDIEGFKSANPTIERVDCIERQIQVFENTAIVSTVVYLKGVFGGNQVEAKSRFLRTWKKFDDGWKIIGVACFNLA